MFRVQLREKSTEIPVNSLRCWKICKFRAEFDDFKAEFQQRPVFFPVLCCGSRILMKLTVERTVLAGFVIVLVLLGTVGIVSQRTIIGLIEDSKWVTHTHVVLELLQQVSFRMSQAEAAVRQSSL